jgi:hypothetical protein
MSSEYTVTVHELFKYTMRILYTRVTEEWQDLDVTYPKWLTTLVMDEVYYITTMTLVCATCFAVGLVIGTVVTLV